MKFFTQTNTHDVFRTTLVFLALILIGGSSWSSLSAQVSIENKRSERLELIPKEALDDLVKLRIRHTKEVFNWDEAPDQMIWSALVQSDSLAIIGYQPQSPRAEDLYFETRDINGNDWEMARKKIAAKVQSWANLNLTEKEGRSKQVVVEKLPLVPFLIVRLSDLKLISEIREMPEFASIEVGTYSFGSEYKLGEGFCDDDGNPDAPDEMIEYDPDGNPQTVNTRDVSWHTEANGIIDAWNLPGNAQGDNIKVALFDTGLSETNPQFADNVWVSQGSLNRLPIEYHGFHSHDWDGISSVLVDLAENVLNLEQIAQFYGTLDSNTIFDGVFDDCGHGTSMSSIIAGPHTTNGRVGGIAPKVDLASYRVTNDVLLDEAEEKMGIYLGLLHAAGDPDVKVGSMSLGKLFFSSWISDAVKTYIAEDKLLFCAAGTADLDFLEQVGEDLNLDTDILGFELLDWLGVPTLNDYLTGSQEDFEIVIFPASMRETIAVTGQKETSGVLCSDCLGGDRVDMSPIMEHVGVSGEAFPPAYAGNAVGGWMRFSGGSSCATATAAATAALIWGERPSSESGSILNAMLEGISGNTSGTISRTPYLGSGFIDAAVAIQSLPRQTFYTTQPSIVTMHITKIDFPLGVGDGFHNWWTEWAIDLNGREHYAKVKNGGLGGAMMHSGHPLSYLKDNDHGSLGGLMKIPLGVVNGAGPYEMPFNYSIHEDDDKGFDLDQSGWDDHDDYVTIGSTQIHVFEDGDFTIYLGDGKEITFHFELDFEPVSFLSPCIDTEVVCEGQDATFTAFPENADTYTFFRDTNNNSWQDAFEPTLQQGSSRVFIRKIGTNFDFKDGEFLGVKVESGGITEFANVEVKSVAFPSVVAIANPQAVASYNFKIEEIQQCYQSYQYQWYFGDGTNSYPAPVSLGQYIDNQPVTMGYIENLTHNYQTNAQIATLYLYSQSGAYVGAIEVDVDPFVSNPPTCYFDTYPDTYSLWAPKQNSLKKLSITINAEWEGPSEYVQFTYNWGDGSSETHLGPGTRVHYYPGNGTYHYTVTMIDILNLNACEEVKTHYVTFSTPSIKGGFTTVAEYYNTDNIFLVSNIHEYIGGVFGGTKSVLIGGKSSDEIASIPKYRLFPNPCPGFVNVSLDNTQHELSWIKVINAQGQVIQFLENIGHNNVQLNQLPQGILFVQLASIDRESGEQIVETKRLISSK